MLGLDDYEIYDNDLYMEMFTYDRNRMIAGWFMVETNSGDTIEVGSIANDTLSLKLIALENNVADADCQTWKNEWRNVYSLGRPPIDTNYYELQVYLGEPGTETYADRNLYHQNGTPYIQILGLDVSGYYDSLPDGKIDCSNRSIFWPEKAYLFLPDPKPFDPDTSYAINNAQLQVTVPEIYNTRRSTITSNPTQYTEYYFEYKWAE
jgi:cell surface protein SprA